MADGSNRSRAIGNCLGVIRRHTPFIAKVKRHAPGQTSRDLAKFCVDRPGRIPAGKRDAKCLLSQRLARLAQDEGSCIRGQVGCADHFPVHVSYVSRRTYATNATVAIRSHMRPCFARYC
jgi:hypothetical protein